MSYIYNTKIKITIWEFYNIDLMKNQKEILCIDTIVLLRQDWVCFANYNYFIKCVTSKEIYNLLVIPLTIQSKQLNIGFENSFMKKSILIFS